MKREGFTFIEILVSLNILIIALVPTAAGISRSLSKYKHYQQREELLDILNNLSVYLQLGGGEIKTGELNLIYSEEREGYLLDREFFTARHLKEKELKFDLILKNTSEERLKYARLTSKYSEKMKREFFIFSKGKL